MSHWRKVDTRIWNDERFLSLSMDGKLTFIALLTHPSMTALGAMRGTPGSLAEELGSSTNHQGLVERFREGFAEVLAKGMAEHDPQGRLIALPNFLKYNQPANPNVVRAWGKWLEFLPECELRSLVIHRAKSCAEGLGKPFAKAFAAAFPNTVSSEQTAVIRQQSHTKHNQEEKTSKGIRRLETADADGVLHLDPDEWHGDDL